MFFAEVGSSHLVSVVCMENPERVLGFGFSPEKAIDRLSRPGCDRSTRRVRVSYCDTSWCCDLNATVPHVATTAECGGMVGLHSSLALLVVVERQLDHTFVTARLRVVIPRGGGEVELCSVEVMQ
ncbi:hypothetical protein Taro_005322 [Colocasia esculenta]|uniref:Uncharacterized protein n=1 Tax=Colocasia esculenta TaxID=4460 RepID=A0A843TXH6_COLES|nr:hypothetical protein [Colocasia esculenta]